MKPHKPNTGGLRGSLAVIAAVWIALLQMLTAAHAWSGDASTPDHDARECLVCIHADRSSDATPSAPELSHAYALKPIMDDDAAAPAFVAFDYPRRLSLRGPPQDPNR